MHKKSVESIAKLLAPEKTMILGPFLSGSLSCHDPCDEGDPIGSAEEHGRKPLQKRVFAGAMSFAIDSVVIHSGGMDSSICLALAKQEFGAKNVLSLSFDYGQRHSPELKQAKQICSDWGIDHHVLPIHCLNAITKNSLTYHEMAIEHHEGSPPNSLVVGRNGLMARLGAIHAHHLGATHISMGVIEVDGSNSGYRDCSRKYMDLMQEVLRLDLGDDAFEIRTPLVFMSKAQTLEVAEKLGVLDYLLENTITCYQGLPREGCGKCPACLLKLAGIREFLAGR